MTGVQTCALPISQAADIAGGTLYVNRSSTDTNATNYARYASTIVVAEISA